MIQLYTVANQTLYPFNVTDAFNKLHSIAAGGSDKVPLAMSNLVNADFVSGITSGKITVTPTEVSIYSVPNLKNYPVSLKDSLGIPQVINAYATKNLALTSADSSSDTIKSLKAQGILGSLTAVTAANLTQSFLPVVLEDGHVPGIFAITPTTFNGTETSFDLSGSAVAGRTVPIQKISTGPAFPFLPRLSAYMGSVYSKALQARNDWTSQAGYIPLENILPSSSWQQAQVNPGQFTYTQGILIYSLCYGNTAPISVSTTVSAPTVTTPYTLAWKVNAQFANQNGLRFVDFNWVSAFQVSFPTKEPAYITVTSNPAEGDVKAFVLSQGNQAKNAGITQNTIRLVKVIQGAVTAGSRAFTFTIYDRQGNATSVGLTLNIS